ncbi:hypothetical protein D3C86_2250700 [compost metagenome]
MAEAHPQVVDGDAAGLHIGLHDLFSCTERQGISTWPIHRTSALLPMPSTPMKSMPTTMSA